MDSKDWIILSSLSIVVLLVGILIAQQMSSKTADAPVTGNAIVATGSFSGDTFEGQITNTKVKPGQFVGTGVYDRNCQRIAGGFTNCHAGIQTKELGLLDFNYEHNMAVKPCLAPGDKVIVSILDASGKATVQRRY